MKETIEFVYQDLVYVTSKVFPLQNALCMVIGKHKIYSDTCAVIVLDENWNFGHNCDDGNCELWCPPLTKNNGLYVLGCNIIPYKKKQCFGRQ